MGYDCRDYADLPLDQQAIWPRSDRNVADTVSTTIGIGGPQSLQSCHRRQRQGKTDYGPIGPWQVDDGAKGLLLGPVVVVGMIYNVFYGTDPDDL